MTGRALKNDFLSLNAALTREAVERIGRAGRHSAVIAEAPPGAGKSTLTASVAEALLGEDRRLRLAIVTQTNEQADDLVQSLASRRRVVPVTRMVGGLGPSDAMWGLATGGAIRLSERSDDAEALASRIVVSTARKWQYERARTQKAGAACKYSIALVDEAYQMRSDMLLGIAGLYETLFCVGDPGQLDPFTAVDDSPWKGLPYSPSRAALATLRAFHPDLQPLQLPISWRLPPSAAGIVSSAFYPFSGFQAGTPAGQRQLILGKPGRGARPGDGVDVHAVLDRAAQTGWCYVELEEKITPRTNRGIASVISDIVKRTLKRGATVVDELQPEGVPLAAHRLAIIAAHNDQVESVRYALSQAGVDPDTVVVSTANKIQGREYDMVIVWHPLAGRRDATAFHLEAGRMCVMLSRHRHACIVVNRAGATRLLEEFPDSDPMFLDEPEKFPDGWEANHRVLQHLATCKTVVS